MYAVVRIQRALVISAASARRDHERRAKKRRRELCSLGQFRPVDDSWGHMQRVIMSTVVTLRWKDQETT